MDEANVTNELPPEVLVKIFEHCDLDELVNIVDVCQLWRDVVVHQYTTSGNDLVIRRPDDINDLISLLCKPVSFTKLHVVWGVPIDMDCSSVSLDALANVTSLNHLQSFMFKVKDEDKRGYYRHSRILTALLTLVLQTSTDTLTHLKLINTRFGSSSKVVEVVEACQHLSHLVLNGCNLDEDRHRLVRIIPTLTQLELLDLRGISELRAFGMSFVAAVKRGCPNISNNIVIGWFYVRSSDDVRLLQFVSHVGTLDFGDLDTAQLRSLISCLNECVSVDKLNVTCCGDHLTDDILLSLVQRLHGPKEVCANGCDHLTNEGVVNVITASPQLEDIKIRDINNINTNIIQLLDRVVTVKNVDIDATGTNLSDEMRNRPSRELYTGKNGNICLQW